MRRTLVLSFLTAVLLVPAAAGHEPSTLPRLVPPADGPSYFGFTYPAAVIAQMLRPRARGRLATLAWRGNLAADTFDLALRRAVGNWRIVVSASPRTTYRLRGLPRERLLARVRPHDVYGAAGGWSAAVPVAF